MSLPGGQGIFVIPGGSVVHLSTRCEYVVKAGKFESSSVAKVRAACGGEPKVCAACQKLARKLSPR